MVDKKIITLMVLVLGISFAVAGIGEFLSEDKTISRDKFTVGEITKMESLGIETFDYEDKDEEKKEVRNLISNNDFNLPEVHVKTTYENCINFSSEVNLCLEEEALNYTDKEINDLLDEAMIKKMKQIVGVQIERESLNSNDVRDGSVVIEK